MARNRNRQPGPIRRTLITRPDPTPGTSPALRTPDRIVVTGPGPRIGRTTGSGQPSGDGSGLSDWTRPANLPPSLARVAHDSKWSATVNNQPA